MVSDDYTGSARGASAERLPPGALQSPAAERNKQPISEVLARLLPEAGVVLEIASGTGQHIAHFARRMPGLVWQPSEPDESMHESIRAHLATAPGAAVREPLGLDVLDLPWPIERAAAIVCINMLHIAPWAAAGALFTGAAGILPRDARLILYGPFRIAGRHTAPSNAAFDASLKARNRDWGVRDLDDVTALAARHGFELEERVPMPANNNVVAYRRS